jgi:outer membrane protein OmpA-like peptidoglycan-associated protein
MKARYFLSLPLAATLMIPAIAQQDSQNSNPATTTTDQTTQSNTTNQSATTATTKTNEDQNLSAHQPLQPPPHEGFWGHLNPFARKKYVQRQMTPIRDRMNELDELTATNSKQIKDVDSRASEGIRQASDRANQADSHAVEANNKAQQANQTAQQANQRLGKVEQVVGSLDQYQPLTEAEINFHAGQQMLNKQAKEALDQIADQYSKTSQGSIIEVEGFSAGKGQLALHNSQAMAEAVVRYLVIEHNVPIYRIYTVGMGNTVVAAKDGSTPARIHGGRVNVSLLHNSVSDLTQSASSTQPAASTQQ